MINNIVTYHITSHPQLKKQYFFGHFLYLCFVFSHSCEVTQAQLGKGDVICARVPIRFILIKT